MEMINVLRENDRDVKRSRQYIVYLETCVTGPKQVITYFNK